MGSYSYAYHKMHRQAEEHVLELIRYRRMSPEEIVYEYTGNFPPRSDVGDAIRAVTSFNQHYA